MSSPPTFALVAGEPSGDLLGADLISGLVNSHPGARLVGIGGPGMRAAGMETWWDSNELAHFGLFEVLTHLPRLLSIRRKLFRRLRELRPDVFIGIDAPDFNLGLETQLKSAGIRTIHYVSPTVWAWRKGRVRKIARAADKVLCLFPFEPAFYQAHGVEAAYVGHPLARRIPLYNDATEARRQIGIDSARQVVALLPGSRASEVSRLSGPLIEAAQLLSRSMPSLQFISAMANPAVGELFRAAMRQSAGPDITLVDGQSRTVMAAADVVVCASGTATLETMLVNRPLVSVYRLAPATYHLARLTRLLRRQFFALPNILAKQALVPELIQDEVTAENVARETRRWLQDQSARQALSARFDALHSEMIGEAVQSAASVVSNVLPGST
ncbi:MAG TPA: lipid-A-disaccharide synthase [Xanthomonadales bacterium]|nr:lipid-A-disaccharide synthase [Xanthomonadales bacterium]